MGGTESKFNEHMSEVSVKEIIRMSASQELRKIDGIEKEIGEEEHTRERYEELRELDREKYTHQRELDRRFEKKVESVGEEKSEHIRQKYDLEKEKVKMDHQNDIAELIVQMKNTEIGSGTELRIAYMNSVITIIQHNVEYCKGAVPLLEVLITGKLSDKMMASTEEAIEKIYANTKTPQELLDYSKQQIDEYQLKHDKKFEEWLNYAVDKQIITESNKAYLLDEEEQV
jgi:hypothetical protein